MMGFNALDSAWQTTLILLPEIILLLTGMGMMTASAFLAAPRRRWCRAAVWSLLAALVALLFVARYETDMYAAVALNDAMSFWSRLVLLLAGLVVMGLAHDEPADDRAGEFFGALLIINAGSMLVAAANELVFLFVGLELVSIPTYLILYLSSAMRPPRRPRRSTSSSASSPRACSSMAWPSSTARRASAI